MSSNCNPRCVVDNRVLLLGLDQLYREAMKGHERFELLRCARQVSAALDVSAAPVPVEGYYAQDAELTEYFRLVRALQEVDKTRRSEVANLPAYQRLHAVASAPLYGRPQETGRLLPVGRDALSQALLDTVPDWTIARLTTAAHAAARESDDFSLVGLAAYVQDPVVLTALRESVVLYARVEWLGIPARPKIVWQVDEELAEKAGRFVDAFNALFGVELPAPTPEHAEDYWLAYEDAKIIGRCVRLGSDDTRLPVRHYHWAICPGTAGDLIVREFWHPEVWTTDRYRAALAVNDRPDL